MRRSLLPVVTAVILAGGCATEVITYRASQIFPMETGAFFTPYSLGYLASGGVAMAGYDSDAGENALIVRDFDGRTTRRTLASAADLSIVAGRAGAFLVLASDGEATRHVGSVTNGQSAGIRYPRQADASAAGDLGVFGFATNGDWVLTVFTPAGERRGPTVVNTLCPSGCVPEQGFALGGSVVVLLRTTGATREIVVLDRDGALVGAPVDTVPNTWAFRSLSDTTFLVYQPSGVTFNAGHVLTISSAGARISKVALPALTSTTLLFREHRDGVVIYEAGSNGTLTLAARPWNWTAMGTQNQTSSVLTALPDGSVIYRAGGEVRHTGF